MKIKFRKNFFKKSLSFLTFAILTCCIFIYLPCNIYNFSSPQKFHGSYLYNPYRDSFPAWQKTNFHAHAITWKGITNGKQSAKTILTAYRQKGYSYACISNYEKLAKEDAQPNSLEVYEHGYNIRKVHHLVIMPKKICYSDFPLWQFTSAKQFIINKLSANAKAVVLPHPLVKKGYSDDDLKKLSGYNLIEVLNHSVNSSEKWDVALSAGKPVWIIGDDDTHNILDTFQTFTNWTMIDCHQHNKDSLVNNLVDGNAYGVSGKNAINDNTLLSVKAEGIHIFLQVLNNADSIQLIGQNGTIKQVVFNTNKISYRFLNNDTYIRAVVYNRQSKMYLNPVIRYDGKSKPQNILTATINPFDTILYRSFLLLCWMIVVLLINRKDMLLILRWLNRLAENRKKPAFDIIK